MKNKLLLFLTIILLVVTTTVSNISYSYAYENVIVVEEVAEEYVPTMEDHINAYLVKNLDKVNFYISFFGISLDDFKEQLKNNFNEWYLCPVTIGGMALSNANGLSIRHPYLKSIRKGDISPDDCTLSKIIS